MTKALSHLVLPVKSPFSKGGKERVITDKLLVSFLVRLDSHLEAGMTKAPSHLAGRQIPPPISPFLKKNSKRTRFQFPPICHFDPCPEGSRVDRRYLSFTWLREKMRSLYSATPFDKFRIPLPRFHKNLLLGNACILQAPKNYALCPLSDSRYGCGRVEEEAK